MIQHKVRPQTAAARKYDVITALSAWALSQDKSVQRQILRFICLITARYNWQNNHLSPGQSEIARLWSVDVRTVKRDIAALKARGWLVEKQRASQGRVATYGLDLERILADTEEAWGCAGPDLQARLQREPAPAVAVPAQNAQPVGGDERWQRLSRRLAQEDQHVWRTWLAPLTPVVGEGRDVVLRAPSGFHASYVQTHFRSRLEAQIGAPVKLIA